MISQKSKTGFWKRRTATTKPRKYVLNKFPPQGPKSWKMPRPRRDPHKLIAYSPFRTGTAEDLIADYPETYYTDFKVRKPSVRTRMAPRIEQPTS